VEQEVGIGHRAWSIGKYSRQPAAGSRQKKEVGGRRSEVRDQRKAGSQQQAEGRNQRTKDKYSLVGAAFSRDLAISTNFLIF